MSDVKAVPSTGSAGSDESTPHPARTDALPDGSDGAPTVASLDTPAGAALPAFHAGDLLAGRFRIVRLVGQGGMGHVYEAEDEELRDRVALKTIRPDVADDSAAIERFRREIYLARKVTHPNVCRIFDLFHHRLPQGGRSVGFVTMEMLAGETLAERLRRVGPLTQAEALPIVMQAASGLQAAHEAGVVHRDFKPGNVMLVGAGAGAGEGAATRVVVTDFGMAHGSGSGAGSEESARLLGGTAAYMAPEQVTGGPITPATDVFAFGVTLYEMVTGRLPFGRSLADSGQRTSQPPEPPRKHGAGIDDAWERVILRCLKPAPEERFGSALALQKALVRASGSGRKHRLVLLGALLVLAAVVLTRGQREGALPDAPASPRAAVVRTRPAVALLGFKNLAGRPEAAWLSVALTEMLATELAAGERLRTLSGEDVARARAELSLTELDSLGRESLLKLHRSVGADLVVLGSYLSTSAGAPLRLDLRIQDARSGETVAHVTETGTEAALAEMVARVGTAVRTRLGAGEMSLAQQEQTRAARPPGAAAARLYAEGLSRLRLFDAPAARDFLEDAVSVDPGFAMAHAALAEAWARIGDDQKAGRSAHRALELATGLSREDRLAVEGRDHEMARRWDDAIRVYRVLAGFFPDNVDYGLRLAAAQTAAGRSADALGTLDTLRALPAPVGDDPRIELTEAHAAAALSDFRRQQAAAARAAAKGRARGARHVVARALLSEGEAWWALGDMARAAGAYRQARTMFEESGDRWGVARIVNRMAGIPYEQGDLATARRMFEESLELSREIGDRRGVGRQLGNVAEVLYNLGDLQGARKLYAEAMAINRDMGSRELLSDNLYGSALVQGALGDLARAAGLGREALDTARAVGDLRSVGYALHCLGRVQLAQGDVAAARRSHEEALALRERLGQREAAHLSRLALAQVALAEDRPDLAAPLARSVAEAFAREGFADYEAEARTAVADALVYDRRSEAAAAIGRAVLLAGRSQNVHVRLGTTIAAAGFRARIGDAQTAYDALLPVLDEARSLGLVALELHAAHALGEAEIAAGRVDAGAARLRQVALTARTRGFGLVARRAANAGEDPKRHGPVR